MNIWVEDATDAELIRELIRRHGTDSAPLKHEWALGLWRVVLVPDQHHCVTIILPVAGEILSGGTK